MSITDNKYNMTMWQGSTFGTSIQVKDANDDPQNLSGYSARMQIRRNYMNAQVEESLSSSNGEIVINASEGELSLVLPAERTANIWVDLSTGRPPKTTYVYDIELQDSSGIVSKILYGDLIVYGEVTR